jgi:hypothetical protein
MKPGTIVELIQSGFEWSAEIGARATIVDGKKTFPELYDKLVRLLTNMGTLDDVKDFLWLEWDRSDPRWHQQTDGAYHKTRFKVVALCGEPKNNDGRKYCFWCGGLTKLFPGFCNTYNLCANCGK